MAITNGINGFHGANGTAKTPGPSAAQIDAVKAVVRPNLIKQTMLENRLAYSFGMRVAFSVEMPLVAKRAGYTSLLMNMEHMAIDMQTMSNVCVSCLNVGITPTVVVPTVAAEWVARCLDSGAQAVIIPHVNNVAEAKICVNAGKYPPMGHRSITMVTPQTQYETGLNYAALAPIVNDEILIMPMIETQEGLDNIEEIAAVEGIDCIVIGCSDLCFELGIPGQQDNLKFHAAIDKICKAADAASVNGRKVFVGLGGLEPRPDLLIHFTKKYDCIRYAMAGRDFAMLISAMNKQAGEMEGISRGLSE